MDTGSTQSRRLLDYIQVQTLVIISNEEMKTLSPPPLLVAAAAVLKRKYTERSCLGRGAHDGDVLAANKDIAPRPQAQAIGPAHAT